MRRGWMDLARRFATTTAVALPLCLALPQLAGGENRAYEEPSDTVHPLLTAHSQAMRQAVYKVTDRVYVAVGYATANSTMVIGDDGIIIIDTTESLVSAEAIRAEFRKITQLPVKGLVYSHHHLDHVGGASAFVSLEDAKTGQVTVVAHEGLPTLMAGSTNTRTNSRLTRDVSMARFAYMFGAYLPWGPEGVVNNGAGPPMAFGAVGVVPPNTIFTDTLELTVAGVRMHLVHVPGETDDGAAVWMPDLGVLQTGELIMSESFPNLYTLRGSEIRNPVTWVRSVDRLRGLPAEHLVLSHGRPTSGRDEVASVLTNYRDAIQYVHDQTLRFINKGEGPDELAARIRELPPHLKDQPYLSEFYGSVTSAVRQLYRTYLGWFTGDPTSLDPLPPVERARRYVKVMGGRERVLEEARSALEAEDYRWAADVLTHVIRANPEAQEARKLKAEALRQLGYRQLNTNFRHWYLTSALELEGQRLELQLDWFRTATSPRAVWAQLQSVPTEGLLTILGTRLQAERTIDVHQTFAFVIDDTDEHYAVEIRRGVAQVHSQAPDEVDFTLNTSKRILAGLVAGQTTLAQALDAQDASLGGDRRGGEAFLAYFDPPLKDWSALQPSLR